MTSTGGLTPRGAAGAGPTDVREGGAVRRRIDRSTRIDIFLVAVTVLLLAITVFFTFSPDDGARPATSGREEIGRLLAQTNEVRRRFDGDLVWDDITVGSPLYARDAVFVADESAATIALSSGGQIAIDERSLVVLRMAPAQAAPTVEVVAGAASGESGASGLTIAAGGATLKVEKGSRVRLRVDRDKRAEVTVAAGSARLQGAGGALELAAGERQAVDAAGSPQGARERVDLVLVEPASAARVFAATTTSVRFRWAETGDWQLEVAGDPGFTNLVASVRTGESEATVEGLAPGVYFWRVRAIPGAAALRASEERALIVVRDVPPEPYRPLANEVVDLSSAAAIDLAWLAIDGATGYELALDRGRGTDLLLSEQVNRPFTSVPRSRFTSEGEHCFRVRVAGRDTAPWSAPRCFRVILSPVLPPPVLFDPKDAARQEQGSLWWSLVGSVAHAEDALAPLDLEWGTIAGATAYTIEISERQDFATSVVREQVPYPRYRFIPPAPRTYYWRVRGIDAHGRPGLNSEARTLALAIPTPVLVAPADNHKVGFAEAAPAVRLRWRAGADAATFTVEIASTPSFDAGVERRTVTGLETVLTPPRPGDLYWRVTALGAHGGRGEPSAARHLVVFAAAPALLAPDDGAALPTAGETTAVTLRWSPRPVARYEVELARDPEFAAPLARERADGISLALPLPGVGQFFWRVRGGGPATAWSEPRRLAVTPAAPEPLAPAADWRGPVGSNGASASLRFAWTPVAGAEGYELFLAGTPADETPRNLPSTEPALEVALAPGTYSWQVRALAPGGVASPLSAARGLSIERRGPVGRPGREPGAGPGAGSVATGVGTLELAPSIAFFANFGGVISPRFGLGLGYRLPVLGGRLRAVLTGAYYMATSHFGDDRVAVDAQIHGVPIEAGVLFAVPEAWLGGFDRFTVVAGLALSVTVAYAAVAITGQPRQELADVMAGATISLGAERDLGPGALFAELAYTLSSHSAGLVALDPGGLALGLGYRFQLW